MPDHADGAAVHDRRQPPFCYQTHEALDVVRAHFTGARRPTALAVYLSLTEAANRNGGARARGGFSASRADIAEGAGVSVDTLDRYAADFVKIGLLTVERRRVEGVNLPNLWALLEPGPVPPVAAPVRPGGSRTGAAQKPKRRAEKEGETSSPAGGALEPAALDPEVPPPVAIVGGQNQPLNLLLDLCGIDPDSPRMGQAVAALNGARGQPGIRHLFWREAYRWAEQHEQLDRLAEIAGDPVKLSNALVGAIQRKAAKYREAMHGAILTPTALRDWWLDLERQNARADGGLTPEQMERFES